MKCNIWSKKFLLFLVLEIINDLSMIVIFLLPPHPHNGLIKFVEELLIINNGGNWFHNE